MQNIYEKYFISIQKKYPAKQDTFKKKTIK